MFKVAQPIGNLYSSEDPCAILETWSRIWGGGDPIKIWGPKKTPISFNFHLASALLLNGPITQDIANLKMDY